jgi:hypothetical protein
MLSDSLFCAANAIQSHVSSSDNFYDEGTKRAAWEIIRLMEKLRAKLDGGTSPTDEHIDECITERKKEADAEYLKFLENYEKLYGAAQAAKTA